VNIPNSDKRRHAWIGKVPLAHAYTEVIAVRKHDEIKGHQSFPRGKSSAQQNRFILQQAWSLQRNTTSQDYRRADVDKECLLLLEEALFETSMRAGQAGHFQWGLDAGPHQNNWSPYNNRPAHWNHNDRDGSESELIVRTVVLLSGVRLNLRAIFPQHGPHFKTPAKATENPSQSEAQHASVKAHRPRPRPRRGKAT
jgi:hypothetical protein